MPIDNGYAPGRSSLRAVVLLAIAFLFAACSSSDDDDNPAAPTPTQPAAASELIVLEAKHSVPGDPNSTDIYTIDPESGARVRLTNDGSSRHPAWSPDHSQIIFSSDAGEADSQEELYIMQADGSDVRRITTTPGISEWHPRISPDGTRIAYMSLENDVAFVKTMNLDGSNDQRVTEAFKLLRSGVWSPDGKEIFFSGLKTDDTQFDIFSIDVETRELRLRIGTEYSEACPHVTHDGRTLMYGNSLEEPDGTMNQDLFMHDLVEGDTSGASDTRFTFSPGIDDYGDPDAADGTFAFISNRDGNLELYLIDRDGTNERRVTATPDLDEENPDW
jgi:TolB protein